MTAKKKALSFEEQFVNGVMMEQFIKSNESTFPAIQQAIINSGLTDEEISDRCNRGPQTIKKVREGNYSHFEDYGPYASTLDEIRAALRLYVAMGVEPIKVKKNKSPLQVVKGGNKSKRK